MGLLPGICRRPLTVGAHLLLAATAISSEFSILHACVFFCEDKEGESSLTKPALFFWETSPVSTNPSISSDHAFCHFIVLLSFCHFVILSFCYFVVLSFYHFVILSFCLLDAARGERGLPPPQLVPATPPPSRGGLPKTPPGQQPPRDPPAPAGHPGAAAVCSGTTASPPSQQLPVTRFWSQPFH